jgi:hypothetical protein
MHELLLSPYLLVYTILLPSVYSSKVPKHTFGKYGVYYRTCTRTTGLILLLFQAKSVDGACRCARRHSALLKRARRHSALFGVVIALEVGYRVNHHPTMQPPQRSACQQWRTRRTRTSTKPEGGGARLSEHGEQQQERSAPQPQHFEIWGSDQNSSRHPRLFL